MALDFNGLLQVRVAQIALDRKFEIHGGRASMRNAATGGRVHGDTAFEMPEARVILCIKLDGSRGRCQVSTGHSLDCEAARGVKLRNGTIVAKVNHRIGCVDLVSLGLCRRRVETAHRGVALNLGVIGVHLHWF